MPTLQMEGNVAIIGGGRMGEAIARGLIASEALPAQRIAIAEPSATRRDELEAAHGVPTFEDGAAALQGASVAILAVKPQVIDVVAVALADALAGKLVVSIAVGITTARLETELAEGTAVVRVMPNTPAMVGEGMAVISGGSAATDAQVELVRQLFLALGEAVVLDEGHQDAAAAISGSGPAYMALVIDALARGGVRNGLPRDVAQKLAEQTMRGTAALLEESGMHPAALIDGVTSPGGTTIAALSVLETRAVRSAFMDAVDAAVARAKELG